MALLLKPNGFGIWGEEPYGAKLLLPEFKDHYGAKLLLPKLCPTGFQNMHSDTKLTAKDATDAKHQQIRRLRELNPMGDVVDQESAQSQVKQ